MKIIKLAFMLVTWVVRLLLNVFILAIVCPSVVADEAHILLERYQGMIGESFAGNANHVSKWWGRFLEKYD